MKQKTDLSETLFYPGTTCKRVEEVFPKHKGIQEAFHGFAYAVGCKKHIARINKSLIFLTETDKEILQEYGNVLDETLSRLKQLYINLPKNLQTDKKIKDLMAKETNPTRFRNRLLLKRLPGKEATKEIEKLTSFICLYIKDILTVIKTLAHNHNKELCKRKEEVVENKCISPEHQL